MLPVFTCVIVLCPRTRVRRPRRANWEICSSVLKGNWMQKKTFFLIIIFQNIRVFTVWYLLKCKLQTLSSLLPCSEHGAPEMRLKPFSLRENINLMLFFKWGFLRIIWFEGHTSLYILYIRLSWKSQRPQRQRGQKHSLIYLIISANTIDTNHPLS